MDMDDCRFSIMPAYRPEQTPEPKPVVRKVIVPVELSFEEQLAQNSAKLKPAGSRKAKIDEEKSMQEDELFSNLSYIDSSSHSGIVTQSS